MDESIKTIQNSMSGDVSVNPSDIDYYSTDGGIFELTPTGIIYPKDTRDVQTLVKTINELNAKGAGLSLTARGNGTDQGGGPINNGLIVDFMRYMDHILEVGDNYVVVQPGCIYQRLQDELHLQHRYIPSYPASIGVCTIGGAIANNSAGEKTVKYGATRDYVEAIQVVLSDGTATWVHPMDEADLQEKCDIDSAEGHIYREIRTLLTHNFDVIHTDHPGTTKESSGYALWKLRRDGQFDLGQVIVGSQGTLCLVTAVRLRTIPLPNPSDVMLLVSYYDDIHSVSKAAMELNTLQPSALEIVDHNLLSLVTEQDSHLLDGLLPEGKIPGFVLLSEFDNAERDDRDAIERQAREIFSELASSSVVHYDIDQKARFWRLRRSAAAVMWTIPGKVKALPIIEDGAVPPEHLDEFLAESYKLFEKYSLRIAVWGHAGDANLHMQPFMDLSDDNDRQKLFSLTDDYYAMVQRLGGTVAGEHNDSLMRAPYRSLMFSARMEELFLQTKNIFDPHNVFNPHKKVNVDFDYIKKHLRHEYSIRSMENLNREEAEEKIDN